MFFSWFSYRSPWPGVSWNFHTSSCFAFRTIGNHRVDWDFGGILLDSPCQLMGKALLSSFEAIIYWSLLPKYGRWRNWLLGVVSWIALGLCFECSRLPIQESLSCFQRGKNNQFSPNHSWPSGYFCTPVLFLVRFSPQLLASYELG